MKKVLSLFVIVSFFAVSLFFTACEEEEPALPDKPTITTTGAVGQQVAINATKELSFGIDIPGGFASATFTPYGGTFAVPGLMSIEVGATSGSVTGIFTAGDVPGVGQVNLVVHDQNDKYDSRSISFEIIE